jgi:hypothetical protein
VQRHIDFFRPNNRCCRQGFYQAVASISNDTQERASVLAAEEPALGEGYAPSKNRSRSPGLFADLFKDDANYSQSIIE